MGRASCPGKVRHDSFCAFGFVDAGGRDDVRNFCMLRAGSGDLRGLAVLEIRPLFVSAGTGRQLCVP